MRQPDFFPDRTGNRPLTTPDGDVDFSQPSPERLLHHWLGAPAGGLPSPANVAVVRVAPGSGWSEPELTDRTFTRPTWASGSPGPASSGRSSRPVRPARVWTKPSR
ncbi:hypothetical protein ACTU45_31340 [Streptomyces sp. 24-1644]|uniref:hypothetical protein n=1 Tax=Streptomyces sp. 24-1644 TaxID=3457315 RepID=UPI003FA6E537